MTERVKREEKASHKRGDKRNEQATKHRKKARNFKQSKDIHEDRVTIQFKSDLFKKRTPKGHS